MIHFQKTLSWLVAGFMLATGWLQAASITNGGFESGLAGWKSLWVDDFALQPTPTSRARRKDLADTLTITNSTLTITIETSTHR